jgi:broad specificity phosphatase PhoE
MLNVSLICAVVMWRASAGRRACVPGSVFHGGMGELVVVRHGQTEWSRTGQHTGTTDLPLLPEGEDQARSLRDALGRRSFVEVRVSPLLRARRTAELAGLPTTSLDRDLVELDYGGYEGRTTAEISEQLGRDWSVWRDGTVDADEPGESLADAGTRVDRVLDRVRPRLADGDVALVAHGHVLRVLTARWLGLAAEAGALFALPARPVLIGWALG